MTAYELSRSAALNELIRAAEGCAENPQDKSAARELASRLKFMAVFVDQLRAQYRSSRELRPATDLMKRLDPTIRQEIDRLKSGLKRIDRWLDDRRTDHLERGCQEAREAADALLTAFDQLREEEETFPTYSRSPLVNELVSVAMGVVRGQTPSEALRVRLEAFYTYWKKTMGDAREWLKSPAENDQVRALAAEVPVEMERLKAGLKLMSRYFSDQRKDQLEKGGQQVSQAAERLLDLRAQILDAASPRVPCPRCSESNPPGSRVCGRCQARLPELAMGPSSTLEVQAGAPQQERFAYLVRLESAVEACLEGRQTPAELRPTVEWFAANVRQGKRSLEALKMPASFPNDEIRQVAESCKQGMETASRLFVDGVEQLESFFGNQERGSLETGMDRIRAGAALMTEAQERMRAVGFAPPR